ncbi:type II secretion system protein [Acetoanaerobium noterae]|uniref:type II secretion system protein n=1 Tax=Acetoanaerobium noterae TaxID=745369 RepID=UPI0028AED800|nr:prepilin-type N-terminal cleavage/methylation domain-containing protein [Acetoanaerobium noterae]
MKKGMKIKKKKGFTLIELIVVIAILGILAAILIPRFGGFQDRARGSQALVEAKQVATAIDAIRAETGSFPDNTDAADLQEITDLAFDGTLPTGSSFTGNIDASGGFEWQVTVGTDTFRAGRTGTGAIQTQP